MWATSGSRTWYIGDAGSGHAVACLAFAPLLLKVESHGIVRGVEHRCVLYCCQLLYFARPPAQDIRDSDAISDSRKRPRYN
jgi:hypothetical protein